MTKKVTIQYVVARYKENLDWLKPVGEQCIIYNKGPKDISLSDFPYQVPLPNVGRETHTYLHHIITHYKTGLADVTVFTQGKITDHLPYGFKSPLEYLKHLARQAVESNSCTFKQSSFYQWTGRISVLNWRSQWVEKCDYNFPEFAKRYIGQTFNPWGRLHWSPGAVVAASKESIQRRSLHSYKNLYELNQTAKPTEIGHYMERLWYYVLDANQCTLEYQNHWINKYFMWDMVQCAYIIFIFVFTLGLIFCLKSIPFHIGKQLKSKYECR